MKRTVNSAFQIQTIATNYSIHSIEENFNKQKLVKATLAPLIRMNSLLDKKIKNKKRYHFQILKQFFLFSSSSFSSSLNSVYKYDPILFTDQKLHSLLKILETQRIQRKIWAFLNLMANKREKQLEQMLKSSSKYIEKVQYIHKEQSFFIIKRFSEERQRERQRTFSTNRIINISISNSTPKKQKKQLQIQKSVKLDMNISKRTAQDTEYDERSLLTKRQNRCFSKNYGCCNSCCNSCCVCSNHCCNQSCCSSNCDDTNIYDLESRIRYLKQLEEFAARNQ